MNVKKREIVLVLIWLTVFLCVPAFLYSESLRDSPHGDRTKLPKGCGSCHRGHGVYNTAMLPERREVFCFRCHGHSTNIENTIRKGDLREVTKETNIQREFEKPYRHPVEKTGIHKYDEILPETDPVAERHSECEDCHHHHQVQKNNKMAGIQGVSNQGFVLDRINFEYELCFKCHANSANLPAYQRNKAELFSTSNPSYHPVITQGRNTDVPSLIRLHPSDLIKCTDCHGNDDPAGPAGPHGSSYRYLLKKNFTSTDGASGSFQYELCYSCHREQSILGNHSFSLHNQHITSTGTSCRTCHNPHGSNRYPHLMDFDNINIGPSSSGRLEFIDLGGRSGECYLTCHGKDHNPMAYPSRSSLF
jgi:predicted CXXCH cytochrome family protein